MRQGACILALAAAAFAAPLAPASDVPDLSLSLLVMASPEATLLVRPDGNGPAFTQARGPGGVVIDATLTLTLVDGFGNPIVNWPREDTWLEAADGGLVSCLGVFSGLLPDRDTDRQGQTVWVDPPLGGGWSTAGAVCYVHDEAMPLAPLDLTFVSPDLNGDGRVDLSDAGPFAADLQGSYAVRSDLNADGVINISDAGIMSSAIGISCP
ncbi:MAG TPA: hypothetical protein PLQ13_04035 [Candidatus Krumholzibacteria bacterium]|nr:hypothetical protein [Candidatus Krumholzibacteria bacterium]